MSFIRRNLALFPIFITLPALVLILPSCQQVSRQNELKAIEKSIAGILGKADNSVVVICSASPNGGDSSEKELTYCSGCVIGSDGIIVTTDGSLESDGELEVLRQNGERYPAIIIGRDFETNLALLKIEADLLPVLTPADSAIQAGCLGFAVANTIYSQGLVCSWGLVNETWIGGDDFLDHQLLFLSIDQPSVHSGTPVLDIAGRLIGIVEGRLEMGNAAWTIIPAQTIEAVEGILLKKGRIERGWVGISSTRSCPEKELVHLMDEFRQKGAVVSSVVSGSPAEKAGIKAGDVVVRLNGQLVKCISDFRRQVTALPPGDTVNLDIIRKGENVQLNLTLTSIPDDPLRQRRCTSRSA